MQCVVPALMSILMSLCTHLDHSERPSHQTLLFIEDAMGGPARRKGSERVSSSLFLGTESEKRDPESCLVSLRINGESEPGWGED